MEAEECPRCQKYFDSSKVMFGQLSDLMGHNNWGHRQANHIIGRSQPPLTSFEEVSEEAVQYYNRGLSKDAATRMEALKGIERILGLHEETLYRFPKPAPYDHWCDKCKDPYYTFEREIFGKIADLTGHDAFGHRAAHLVTQPFPKGTSSLADIAKMPRESILDQHGMGPTLRGHILLKVGHLLAPEKC